VSYSIVVGRSTRGNKRCAVYVSNTTGRAFGPVMRDRKEAQDLARRCKGRDPRRVTAGALDRSLYAMREFQDERRVGADRRRVLRGRPTDTDRRMRKFDPSLPYDVIVYVQNGSSEDGMLPTLAAARAVLRREGEKPGDTAVIYEKGTRLEEYRRGRKGWRKVPVRS
jgi:hypothetical protein